MDRREAIKRVALITGYAVSASTVTAVMQGCKADPGAVAGDWTPAFMTNDQAAMIAEMAETILPRTEDSPGARDVNVHQFIDLMMEDYVSEAEQEVFGKGLKQLMAHCQEANGKTFVDLTPEERLAYLTALDKEAMADMEAPGRPDPESLSTFYITLKQSVIAGYFTSEAVGTEVLAYDPVPGEVIACAPTGELTGGRVWAL